MTQALLKTLPWFERAKPQDYGTLPYIHYNLACGQVDGHGAHLSLCFYGEMLLTASISVDLYGEGQHSWDNYSLDVEADTKRFHDRLLMQWLGPARAAASLTMSGLSQEQQVLAQPQNWVFPWGEVGSGHDFKGGGTQIFVVYGRRREEAHKNYRRQGAAKR